MSYSYSEHTGDGSNRNFTLGFPYLEETHVSAVVTPLVGLPTTYDSDDLVFNENGTVDLPVAPASGATAKLFRRTPAADPQVVFQNNNLTDETLNEQVTQIMYLVQEALDDAGGGVALESNMIAYLNQVIALASQVTADAIDVAADKTTAQGAASDAEASATAAAASEAAASASATNAASSEVASEASADAAATSETNAGASEADAATSASGAATSQTAAAASATAAAASATAAGTSASTATAKATEAAASATASSNSAASSVASASSAATYAAQASQAVQNKGFYPPGGRLCLGSDEEISDVAPLSYILWGSSPVSGRSMWFSLYNPATFRWDRYVTNAGISHSLIDASQGADGVAAAANKLYNLYLWMKNGVPVISRGAAWADDVTPPSELYPFDGIHVNIFALTNGPPAQQGLYIGSIMTDAAGLLSFSRGGYAAGGTPAWVPYCNVFNRKPLFINVRDSDTWSYNSSTTRAANGSNGNRATLITNPDAGIPIYIYGRSELSSLGSGVTANMRVAKDTTSVSPSEPDITRYPCRAIPPGTAECFRTEIRTTGKHYYQMVETTGTTATNTWRTASTMLQIRTEF